MCQWSSRCARCCPNSVTTESIRRRRDDDDHVASRFRVLSLLPGAICLIGVGVMTWGSFLPFMSIPYEGGGIEVGNQPPPLFTETLSNLWDGRLVIVALPLFAVAVICQMARIRSVVAAYTCLLASAGAVLLALVEGSDGGHRIIPAWVFPGPFGDPEFASVGVGYGIFLAGAIVAVLASLLMLATTVRGLHAKTEAPLLPLLS